MLGTVGMAGRKRKNGRRLSNGHLAQPYVNPRTLAETQPHRRWLPQGKRLDQRADTALGCLALIGAISEDQCLAGEEYALAVGRYRAVVNPPRGLSGRGGGYDCEPHGCMQNPADPCECRQRTNKYNELYEVVARVGRKPLMAVNRVVIHQQRIPRSEMVLLRTGLEALARHMGLTGGRKSFTRRN